MQGTPPTTQSSVSMRELRHQPRLIVHTGDGKGKSTAAFGLALRGWTQGWSIGVFQFVKSAKWRTGEKKAFEELDRIGAETGVGGRCEWQAMGAGWTWLRSTADVDQAAMARAGWERVAADLCEQRHDLYLLDEFTYVMANGWVDTAEVIDTLASRPGRQHVVITGRRAPQELIDAADLVTSMEKVKHPFDTGAKGQAGIEW